MDISRVFRCSLFGCLVFWAALPAWAESPAQPIKVGIIGLDAHALPWTQILNSPKVQGELATMKIVAGFPGGSPDVPQSMEILRGSVEPIRKLGVEIVDSVDALIRRSDAVMILSIDGRTHLQQAKPVFAARKRVFIDKPLAASLREAIEIFRLAKEHNVPCFSSSALRFSPGTVALRRDAQLNPVCGCDAFSPCPLEPHHPDFFWYGIHGVESLFTIMGPGCSTVTRVHADKGELAVGLWKDGRIGTFRGTREGPHTYGATVFGKGGSAQAGRFEGYEPLLAEIAKFFATGQAPVSAEQTLEILAFMEAADESKRQGGKPIRIEDVMTRARQQRD